QGLLRPKGTTRFFENNSAWDPWRGEGEPPLHLPSSLLVYCSLRQLPTRRKMMGDPNLAMADDVGEEKLMISTEKLTKNTKLIDYCRTSLCIVGGIATGVLGCTGLEGLLAYIVVYITVSLALLAKMGFDPSEYTLTKKGSAPLFIVSGESGYCVTFILFWTLAYALVYIY
ncbi:unnamed protein product, partial [Chrysoparadoxa australica]